MEKVYINYTLISNTDHNRLINDLLPRLPKAMQKKALSYKFEKDQQRYVLGKLLVTEGFTHYGITQNPLLDFKYNAFGKPYLENNVNFNISHSGDYVICAFSTNLEVGIDVEEIKPIEIKSFQTFFTEGEWNTIINSIKRNSTFYEYWTKKEAIIKAVGEGLSVPLNSFSTIENQIQLNNIDYYLKEIFLEQTANYSCFLATSRLSIKSQDLSIRKVAF